MQVFLIAVRNLFGEKARLAITVSGVAFSVTLILILLGLYQGWNLQMTKFLGSIPADFWVGQKGSRDISHSVSILPANLKQAVTNVDGAAEVNTFIGRQVSFKNQGREIRLFLVGIDQASAIRPFKIESGSHFPQKGEIIIDQTIANQKKIKLGDAININGTELKVSGISSGGNLLIYSYAFANLADAQKIINFQTFVNYYLVKSENPDQAKTNLEVAFPNLEVMPKADFLDHNTEVIRTTFLPIIGVLLIIALIIGIAVIGLTIYTATIEKSQEYGVLKAIGYRNGQLLSVAFIQSLISGLIGLIVGNALVILIVKVITQFISGFIYEVGSREIVSVIFITILMSALAALIPLKKLFSIDPASVFKA